MLAIILELPVYFLCSKTGPFLHWAALQIFKDIHWVSPKISIQLPHWLVSSLLKIRFRRTHNL